MPQLLEAKQYTMMLFGLHLLGAHMLQHYGMTNLVMQHCCHVSVASLGRPDRIFSGADVGPTLAFCNMNCPDRKTGCKHCPAAPMFVMKRERKCGKNSAPLCYFPSVAVFPPRPIWILAQSSILVSWVNGSVPENQNSYNGTHWHTCIIKKVFVCIYIWISLSPCLLDRIGHVYQSWYSVFLSQQNNISRLISHRNDQANRVYKKKGVPSAKSPRSVRGLEKGVSSKPYPRLCNARRPRLEPGTFRSQTVRLYRLHQAHPSIHMNFSEK